MLLFLLFPWFAARTSWVLNRPLGGGFDYELDGERAKREKKIYL